MSGTNKRLALALALVTLFWLSLSLPNSSAQTRRSVSPKAQAPVGPVQQDPNPNQKRATIVANPQRGAVVVPQRAPRLQLIVDRDHAQVGEMVKFTLTPPNLVLKSPFLFTMNFGDGTPPVQQANRNEFTHEYHSNGDFTVSVSISDPPREVFEVRPVMGNTVAVHIDHAPLLVSPSSLELGQHPVFFATKFFSSESNIRYKFVFGDLFFLGDWQEQPQATHVYFVPNTYQAHVEIGRMIRGTVVPIDSSETKPIDVKAPTATPSVSFSVNPQPVVAGSPATFVAQSVFSDPNIRYRFDFGDASPPSDWKETRDASHQYAPGGPYPAFAEMAVLDRGVMTTVAFSEKKQITVAGPSSVGGTSPPQSTVTPGSNRAPGTSGRPVDWLLDNWWKLLIVGVTVLVIASSVLKWGFSAHPPTFHPHPDDGAGAENVGSPSLGIDYQVVLNRNLSQGYFQIHWDTPSLISSVRRENG